MLIRKWQSESVWPKHHDAYKNELSVYVCMGWAVDATDPTQEPILESARVPKQ
jgi:hypothetical protein